MDDVKGMESSASEQLLAEKATKIAGRLTVFKQTLDRTVRALAAKDLKFSAWSPEMVEKAVTLAAPAALQDACNPSSHLLNILQTGRAPILLRYLGEGPANALGADRLGAPLPKAFRMVPAADILDSIQCLLTEWQAEINLLSLLLPDHLARVTQYLESFDREFLSNQTKFAIDERLP